MTGTAAYRLLADGGHSIRYTFREYPERSAAMRKILAILSLAVFSPLAFGLSPDYLAGDWCYSHYLAGGEREPQNITYVFRTDGTLRYQTTSRSEVDEPGTWQIKDGVVKIKPAFVMFNFTVSEKSRDRLVLDSLGQHVFLRGACN